MNSPDMFVDYDFVSKIEINDERDFILAGYLYPDTYMFDVNSKPETIIRKFLNNMKSKLYDEYYGQFEMLQYTQIPFQDYRLPVYYAKCEKPRGDIVIHGGYDSRSRI